VSMFDSSSSLFGLVFVLFFLGLMILFGLVRKKQPKRGFRDISAFNRLQRAIGLAVEAGQRVHLTLGHGGIDGPRGAAGLVGLSVIQRVARAASISDKPPLATSGEAALATLSLDVLQAAHQSVSAGGRIDPSSAILTGVTPFSYAAGTLPVIYDQQVSMNLMLGSFGSEAALIVDAGEHTGSLIIGGSDDLTAQAVLFASAQEPLVGEELYAAGAYLQVNPMHNASLIAQDWLRWILIGIILAGGLAKLAGIL